MIQLSEIMDSALAAVRANFKVRNQRAFIGMPEQQARLVAVRKNQIREWIAVVRTLQDPRNHDHVLARVTDRGEFSGRTLMSHDLRNRVILGGLDAMIERVEGQRQQRMADRPVV